MIDSLKKNLELEGKILTEIKMFMMHGSSTPSERRLIQSAISSLENKLRIINSSIPDILDQIGQVKKISPVDGKKAQLEKVEIPKSQGIPSTTITLKKEDKKKFLAEANIDYSFLKKIKSNIQKEKEEVNEFKGSRGYIKFSNKFFLGYAQKLISKGYFSDLKIDLSKANLDVLFTSYVAMMLCSTFIGIFVGIAISFILLFFEISFLFPFFSVYSGDILSRMLQTSWLSIAIPIGTFFAFYYYPSSEKDSISKNIDQELPFAVIHMSAISGSGIEPSEIFKIIGKSKEYVALRKEIRKILNQINIYGYDLITALNNVAKNTPSQKLSELLAGLSTTITSGGDLSDFFQKRSETLLMGYRLERERFTKVAETFMDIYISLVIAAPMILMLLLVMIQISNINIGFSTGQLTFLIIGAIAILNVFFIAFLHLKQPKY